MLAIVNEATTLLAQNDIHLSQIGIVGWVILLIIVVAVVAIGLIFLRVAGIQVPQWAWQVFWIVVAAVVCILAIKFLVGLSWS